MFELLTTAHLAEMVDALSRLDERVEDAERIDQIRFLEEVKAAASAAQAKVTIQFEASQRATQVDAGFTGSAVGRGIASQVALAKRESPARGRTYLSWTRALMDMPRLFDELRSGRICEWKAQIVARESSWLSAEHRAILDNELTGRMESMGERQVDHEVKRISYRLDPDGFNARLTHAVGDRRVTLRPAPFAMSYLTALLPIAEGGAAYSALASHAATQRAAEGRSRARDQIMADTLVERVTGQAAATEVSVEVQVVMTDQTLLGFGEGGDEPAVVNGVSMIPADLARRLARNAAESEGARLWLRRFYTHPDSGRLVAMESRRRRFEGGLAQFLMVRDRRCRTPWCDAPVRHGDHVVAFEAGGRTTEANGQGLCEACNYAKEAVGWQARPAPDGAGTYVDITTPTGHRYRSRPPDPPGHQPPRMPSLEAHLERLIAHSAA